ncbi:sugar ABC transporter permease [Microbacterium keratanolyticum]|uniref:Sugar ABC transporter permease n=1 Tax=Microbacterium keratanolyticum TaxID=67574 RepID=A0A9W6HQF7_9MICO|nr:carbohydrate ABC transporter permease [Microbacterium keratanolyticum]GLK00505.1 sugar ABC transporter permease [Microbacterium keratanolyticum]
MIVPKATRLALWVWVAFNIFMALWVGLTSLKSDEEIFSSPFGLPSSPDWDNFASAWTTSGFGGVTLNSIVVVSVSAAVTILLAAPAAYVLARSNRRWVSAMNTYTALCVALPVQTILVPLFVAKTEIYRFAVEIAFGWWDDRITLILIYIGTSLPFTIFLLTAAFKGLPTSLSEAAALDGATPARTFWSIMAPLAWPAVKSAFILNFLNMWNEALLVMVLITSPSQQTLPAALLRLYSTMQYTSNWGGLFAGMVIVVYPMILLYLWVGRRIMEGMTSGAVK